MKFDFVVSRAVTELKNFLPWIWNSLLAGKRDGIERGVLYLKGGELGEEISVAAGAMRIPAERIGINEISKWFKEPFFEGKMVLYIKR
jgi:16S rRNA (guanine527-N7)-methyltransferase